MEKEKKAINILIVFFISHKNDVKTFIKWILNQCRTALVNMTLCFLWLWVKFNELWWVAVLWADFSGYDYGY